MAIRVWLTLTLNQCKTLRTNFTSNRKFSSPTLPLESSKNTKSCSSFSCIYFSLSIRKPIVVWFPPFSIILRSLTGIVCGDCQVIPNANWTKFWTKSTILKRTIYIYVLTIGRSICFDDGFRLNTKDTTKHKTFYFLCKRFEYSKYDVEKSFIGTWFKC